MIYEDYVDDNYITVSKNLLKNPYYRQMLSPTDKAIFQILQASVIYDENYKYFKNGILAANVKVETIASQFGGRGLKKRSIEASLAWLNRLGVVIRVRKSRNSTTILGFRLNESKDNYYLIYHLVENYKDDMAGLKDNLVKIEDICLDKEIRNHIETYALSPMIYKIGLNSGNHLMKELFGINNYINKANTVFRNFLSKAI